MPGKGVGKKKTADVSFPRPDFEAFDALEFLGVGGDEGGSKTAGLGGDEEIHRADRYAPGFERGADVGVMEGGIESEVRELEEPQKGF